MKNSIIFSIFITTFIALSSCSTSYLMIAEGEQFNALTKITDDKKVCIQPNGGDDGRNLVFCGLEDDGSYNIYMKDNVLSSSLIQKSSGTNFNISPSYCSANEKIAFQYLSSNNFDIYYINSKSGKAITQVTSTDDNEFNPNWSSDGKMIVFEKGATPKLYVKYKTNGYIQGIKVTKNQVWIKNLETGELKMIGQGSFPKFSRDNSEIVFVKYELNKAKTKETGTIWTMTADGENQKQITGVDLGYASCPNWSPKGKNIVFQLTKKNKIDSDIYTIGINGENLIQYTTNKSNDFSPYWTSDNQIYFSSDRGSVAHKYQIWRFKINVEL